LQTVFIFKYKYCCSGSGNFSRSQDDIYLYLGVIQFDERLIQNMEAPAICGGNFEDKIIKSALYEIQI